jgi:hypothetical protein
MLPTQGFGHIVLTHTKGNLVDWIIRFVTRSKFNHAFVIMPSILDVPMCAEDSGLGVDMLRFDTNYLNDPNEQIEVWQVNIADVFKMNGLKEVINVLEQGYGYLELPWFAWRSLCALFGKDIKSQDNWSQKNSVCSGLVRNRYISGCGLSYLFKAFGKNSVNPQDISDIAHNNSNIFTKIYSNVK